ncbi:hypothetical protein WHT83_06360 [Aminobacter sp. P9b]|uniref:hypothetical protein n=1 Tax=Aminobacter sp. P9b TaxID=3133697 RepID=UPI0032479E03
MMTDERKPMANIAPFGLRMQPDLKARVEDAAKLNNRSLNAEIVAVLEEKYPAPMDFDQDAFVAKWIDPILANKISPGLEFDYQLNQRLLHNADQAAKSINPHLGVWERIIGDKWEVVFGIRDKSLIPADKRSTLMQNFATTTWRRVYG